MKKFVYSAICAIGFLFPIVVALGLWTGVVLVAIHFIKKFW